MNERPDWQGNGWTQYQKLVLAQLEAHTEELQRLSEKISELRVEISALKIQAGLWGLTAGLLPAVGALIMIFLTRK